jgi:hypothetical protein
MVIALRRLRSAAAADLRAWADRQTTSIQAWRAQHPEPEWEKTLVGNGLRQREVLRDLAEAIADALEPPR